MNRRHAGLVVAGLAALGFVGLPVAGAEAQNTVKPAIVYSTGGKFDKSFNEGVSQGADKFKKETSIAVVEFEPTNETQFEQALRRFAQRGQDPIIAVGFSQGVALDKVAKEALNTHFTIIDMVVPLPNVQSVVFKEHEGSFLVGVLAAMASKTGKVGFVGGMDIPLIRKFGCGYAQGVKAAKPDAVIFQNMTGDTGAAWNDPVKGGEITKGQMAQGADVVYAAAGATGLGVLQAAAEHLREEVRGVVGVVAERQAGQAEDEVRLLHRQPDRLDRDDAHHDDDRVQRVRVEEPADQEPTEPRDLARVTDRRRELPERQGREDADEETAEHGGTQGRRHGEPGRAQDVRRKAQGSGRRRH